MRSQGTLGLKTILSSVTGVAAAAGLAMALTGCAGNIPANFGTAGTPVTGAVHMTGTVHGGQQPVVGATIQLYAVGTGGNGSASTALISNPPQTIAGGVFNITGLYSCTGYTDVYIVATGGYPSGSSSTGTANPNLSLVAALGDCATLKNNAATTSITLNEVTTAAAAYALAPFAKDVTDVGTNFGSATTVVPTGLAIAFKNATLLADTTQGASPGVGLAAGVTVPNTEINTIANILAACVNSSGAGSSTCKPLFSATGASDIFGAALAIAKNPGAPAITGLYTLSSGTAPFQPSMTMTSAPNDFSVAVSYTGGTTSLLATPYGIALDAAGDAWVTNASSTQVTVLSPTGVGANLTAAGLFGAQGVAVDQAGNVWVANTAGNSVIEFAAGYAPGGTAPATTAYTAGGVMAPSAIAIDSANNIFVANFNGNSVTGLNSSGTPLSGSPFTASGNITVPTGIAVSPAGTGGNLLVTSGSGTVAVLTNAGAYQSSMNDGTLQGPVSLAYNNGNLAVSGFTTGTAVAGALSEYGSTGSASSVSPVTSGLATPGGVAADGTSFWVANSSTSGGLAKFVFGSAAQASPANGYGSLGTPVGVAVDASGSVWTTNSSGGTVSKFIGLASPAVMPLVVTAGP